MPRHQNSLKDFPIYGENPYMLALLNTEVKEISKRVSMDLKLNAKNNNSIVSMDGEQQLLIKHETVKEDAWIKLYTGSLRHFYDLSKSDLMLLEYITEKQKFNVNTIVLNTTDIVNYHDMNVSTVYRSICILLDRGIIARSESSNTFYTNPDVFFKGSKLTLVKTFTKEKSNEQ